MTRQMSNIYYSKQPEIFIKVITSDNEINENGTNSPGI